MGRSATPVTVIPNGVDSNVFFPSPTGSRANQIVLFVGRLALNKGPQILINAIPDVLKHHPQARFLLTGDGPRKNQLEQQADQLGIRHAIEFLGMRDDVPELMRKASIFVRPSTLEGMPLTVLEAMASAADLVCSGITNFMILIIACISCCDVCFWSEGGAG